MTYNELTAEEQEWITILRNLPSDTRRLSLDLLRVFAVPEKYNETGVVNYDYFRFRKNNGVL